MFNTVQHRRAYRASTRRGAAVHLKNGVGWSRTRHRRRARIVPTPTETGLKVTHLIQPELNISSLFSNFGQESGRTLRHFQHFLEDQGRPRALSCRPVKRVLAIIQAGTCRRPQGEQDTLRRGASPGLHKRELMTESNILDISGNY